MAQPFYLFSSYDQNDCNWLTRVSDKEGGGYGVRFHYLSAFCPSCWQFSHDAVFERGFENTLVRIRVRKGRNILVTDDEFLCVSADLLKALKSKGVQGFESKPLHTGMYWHVLRNTNRRSFDPNIYRTDSRGKVCATCQRAGLYGHIQYEGEIDLPSEELTFFSTDKERGQGGFEIFVTDRLREVLQQSNTNGGELLKLFTPEEERQLKENPKWKRKDNLITLGQHRYGPTE